MKKALGDSDPASPAVAFLSDQPIAADQEQQIRFGHTDLVEILRGIVLACPTPFTIGFMGKWGTGKTTVLDSLWKKLTEAGMGVVKFDVWKHEGDSLRRTFLRDAYNQLKGQGWLSNEYKYDEKLDESSSITSEGKFVFRWPRLIPAGVILLSIVIGSLAFWKLNNDTSKTYFDVLMAVMGGGLVASIVMMFLQPIVTTEKTTRSNDKYKDPYEFESAFTKLIEKAKSKDKLVVIVDNLDRTQHDKAVELLSTIKTYLDQERCVFVVACDADAIKKHLECVYNPNGRSDNGKQAFDSDEFLRKFFNTCIRIPDFIDTELLEYTEELLRETKAVALDSSEVALVITSAFRENPRQIKQFINSLLAHYLVAEARECGDRPSIAPKGYVTGNISFLAKSLIIQQKFPDQYERFWRGEPITEEPEAYGSFIMATKRISAQDIRPFHYLKLSKEELCIPGIKELELALVDNQVESVKLMIGKFANDADKREHFDKYLYFLLARYKNKVPVLFNVISSALVATRDLSLALSNQVYDYMAGLLSNSNGLGKELLHFDSALIFGLVLDQCNSRDRDDILENYLNILKSDVEGLNKGYIESLITELVNHKSWLGDRKSDVGEIISKRYCNYDMLSIFAERSEEDQREFVSFQSLEKFITSLNDSDIDTSVITKKVNLFIALESVVDKAILSALFAKLKDLLSAELAKPYRPARESLVGSIYDVLDTFYDKLEKVDAEGLGQLADTLMRGMDAVGNWSQKKPFVLPCRILSDVLEGQRKTNVDSHFAAFFIGADEPNLLSVIKEVEEKDWLINGREEAFQQAAMKSEAIFSLTYPEVGVKTRSAWLQALLESYPQRALVFLEQNKYTIDDPKAVASKILGKAAQAPISERGSYYTACNALKCADDDSVKIQLTSQLISLLTVANAESQKIGLNALKDASYLSATQKRDMTRAVIDWLRGLNPTTAYQPYAVQSIVVNWQELPETLRNDFFDFVFSKLIKQGLNINSITLGFDILANITPKPEYNDQNRGYFDDTLARVKNEGNAETMAALIGGLIRLKPSYPNRLNKEFWQAVSAFTAES